MTTRTIDLRKKKSLVATIRPYFASAVVSVLLVGYSTYHLSQVKPQTVNEVPSEVRAKVGVIEEDEVEHRSASIAAERHEQIRKQVEAETDQERNERYKREDAEYARRFPSPRNRPINPD